MKNLIIVLFALLPVLALSQTDGGKHQKGVTERIIPVKIGSVNTSAGHIQILFDTEITDEYIVSLTSCEDGITFYVAEKRKDGFVIKSNGQVDGRCDYVVFVKKIKPQQQSPE